MSLHPTSSLQLPNHVVNYFSSCWGISWGNSLWETFSILFLDISLAKLLFQFCQWVVSNYLTEVKIYLEQSEEISFINFPRMLIKINISLSLLGRITWTVDLFVFSISLLARSGFALSIWLYDQQILLPSFKKRRTSLKRPPRLKWTRNVGRSLHRGNRLPVHMCSAGCPCHRFWVWICCPSALWNLNSSLHTAWTSSHTHFTSGSFAKANGSAGS